MKTKFKNKSVLKKTKNKKIDKHNKNTTIKSQKMKKNNTPKKKFVTKTDSGDSDDLEIVEFDDSDESPDPQLLKEIDTFLEKNFSKCDTSESKSKKLKTSLSKDVKNKKGETSSDKNIKKKKDSSENTKNFKNKQNSSPIDKFTEKNSSKCDPSEPKSKKLKASLSKDVKNKKGKTSSDKNIKTEKGSSENTKKLKKKQNSSLEKRVNVFDKSELKSVLSSQIDEIPSKNSKKDTKKSKFPGKGGNSNPENQESLKKSQMNQGSLMPDDLQEKQNIFKEKLKKQLQSASFRLINEKLYTTSGSGAYSMFTEDPEYFKVYHDGYSSQVSQWPVNPVNIISSWLRKKPRNWKVADFGCGDASLSRSVPHKVVSLDLVASGPGVIQSDMAHTPLKTKSMNVVVFCLSLMGTNLTEFIIEANRVLVDNGVLKIAEVESRFDKDASKFLKVMFRLGFKCIQKNIDRKYFWLFEFVKVRDFQPKENNPELILKPCLYKKR